MSEKLSSYVDPLANLETQELIQKLIDNGYGELVECLLGDESVVYTKKGRLNKSSTCRKMGWKNKQLEDILLEMRECLEGKEEEEDSEEEKEE
jgi:hypothetical protein